MDEGGDEKSATYSGVSDTMATKLRFGHLRPNGVATFTDNGEADGLGFLIEESTLSLQYLRVSNILRITLEKGCKTKTAIPFFYWIRRSHSFLQTLSVLSIILSVNVVILHPLMFIKKYSMVKISVITVCYNAINDIEETILSVLNQLYKNIEYIVIDGGSTDGTVDIIKKYNNKIAYWVSEPDNGIYDAMNKGIRQATGDYIININAGDRLLCIPQKTLERYVCDSSYGTCGAIQDEKGDTYYPNISWRMKFRNQLPHQALFYKREKQLLYDTRYKILGDFDLNLQYLKAHGKIHLIDETISIHDFHGISNSPIASSECFSIIKKYYGRIGIALGFIYFKLQAIKAIFRNFTK